MTQDELSKLREQLISICNDCLNSTSFDADGAIILSYVIAWMYAKINNQKFEYLKD